MAHVAEIDDAGDVVVADDDVVIIEVLMDHRGSQIEPWATRGSVGARQHLSDPVEGPLDQVAS